VIINNGASCAACPAGSEKSGATCTCTGTKTYDSVSNTCKCPAGYTDSDATHQCDVCDTENGYYKKITDATAGTFTCVLCTEANDHKIETDKTCVTCTTATEVVDGKECKASCPTGKYADANKVCQACDAKCETCSIKSGASTATCDTCAAGYEDATAGSKLCDKCVDGYYATGTGASLVCTQCPDTLTGCSKCSSATVCTGCKEGYTDVDTDANKATCKEKCLVDVEKCTKCKADHMTCTTCSEKYGLNSTTAPQKCILCNETRSYNDASGVCKECEGELKEAKSDRTGCQCVAHAEDKDGVNCTCVEGYKAKEEACELDETYIACNNSENAPKVPIAVTDKCYNMSVSEQFKFLKEKDQNVTFKHEGGKYKYCNYTNGDCTSTDETCKCEELEGYTCEGGKCTGGYANFPACDVQDSGVMNMIVIALICVAIML